MIRFNSNILEHTAQHGGAMFESLKQFGFESAAHLTSFLSSNGGDDISLFKANLEVQGCLFTMHTMFFSSFSLLGLVTLCLQLS